MKKTRLFAVVLAAVMLVALASCGKTGDNDVTTPASTTAGTKTDAPTSPSTTAPTSPATDAPKTDAPQTTEPAPETKAPAQIDGVYQIGTVDDLIWLSAAGPRDGKYVLTADIAFNPTDDVDKWTTENKPQNTITPIGSSAAPFTGSFNGAGHTISGLYVFGVGETGLFGYINGATIENLIIGKGLVCSYDSNIGSVVGVFNGEGNVIRGCVNYANVTGNAYVGGIAGKYNSSSTARLTIENCANHGNVTATKKSNALYVGGIIPAVVGVQLKSCANFGTVSAGVVGDDSYAASGCAIIGGITGVMSGSGGDASIIDCYNKGNVISCNSGANNGTSAAAGIVGRMNAANGAAGTIKNCYSTGNVYTLTADSKELSASCSTKSGDDYAENVYASGKVLVWNTETENKNATVPACGAPEVSLGTGACDAMNLGTDAWSDASDNTPILKGIPAEHQISAS